MKEQDKVFLIMRLKVEEFIKFRNFIYKKAGLFFTPKKIYFFKKRLEKRMRVKSIEDISGYFNFLCYEDVNGSELQELLNILTTNETYFFREVHQLNAFADNCLQEILERKKNQNKTLKIWSAGCSSGEEAYSLAIILIELIPDISDWSIELLATDIDTNMLQQAKNGIYSERSMRNVSLERLKKYFFVLPEGFSIRSNLKKLVNFKLLNLFETQKTRLIKNVDAIFCRNVLIYFDDNSRKIVVANFYDSLTENGYLFLGHSESVSRINTAFNLKRVNNDMIVHQKPMG